MFWGLIMEPRKRYTQTIERPFHISMAALDISSVDDNQPTQIMATVDDRNYLLCTLQKDKLVQCPLDLSFDTGEHVSFATNGKSHVHLTGYLTLDTSFLDEEDDDDEDLYTDEEIEDEGEDISDLIGKKRKPKAVEGKKSKKLKVSTLLDASLNSDDESDDSDINSDILNASAEGEEEEDDEDMSDLDEDEDEDDDEEESDEVFQKSMKPSVPNGTAAAGSPKSGKKNKQQAAEQQQQQQNGSAKKQKKDVQTSPIAKPEKTPKKDKQQKEQQGQTPKQEKTPKSEKKQQKEKTPVAKTPTPTPQKKTVEGGVVIEDIKVGNGAVAKPGKMLQVYYEGRLKQNNKMFDSTTSGKGFRFRLGQQEVIKGWDVGFNGMKVGGKRRIICPANMAYGNKGSPPTIPGNSTLVFEVELKNVN